MCRPSKANTEGPQFCKNIPFNETELLPIVDKLQIYWSSIQGGNNYNFWKHEWRKHGTCATELTALDDEIKYFDLGLEWIAQYNVTKILSDNQIHPSDDKDHYYNVSKFHEAFKRGTGKNAAIACIQDKVSNIFHTFHPRFLLSPLALTFEPAISTFIFNHL